MARVGEAASPAAPRRARRAPDARAQVPLLVLMALTVGLVVAARSVRGATVQASVLDDAAVAFVAASVLGVLGMPAAVRRGRRRRSGIEAVDAMAGEAFEARLAVLFADVGEEVRHTGRRGDFGADLVTERAGVRTVVQAKRYGGAVGIEAVQQVIGARRYYDAEGARVVTNSFLTPAALALAAANGVEVIERDALVSLLTAHPGDDRVRARWSLCRQCAEGAVLVAYAGLVACRFAGRLTWWLGRSALRGVRRLLTGP